MRHPEWGPFRRIEVYNPNGRHYVLEVGDDKIAYALPNMSDV